MNLNQSKMRTDKGRHGLSHGKIMEKWGSGRNCPKSEQKERNSSAERTQINHTKFSKLPAEILFIVHSFFDTFQSKF